MKRIKQIDVKQALAMAGSFNFLCSCAKACLLPFLTLYFRQLGLTPAMTGIVMGTKHFITLVWSPVVSLLSKHYNKRRVVICGSVVFSAAAALLLLLIPPADVQTQTCNTSDLSVGPTQSPADELLVNSTGPTASHPTRPLVSQSFVTYLHNTLADTKSPVITSETSHHHHHNHTTKSPPYVSQENDSVLVKNGSRVFYTSSSLGTPVRNKRSELRSEQPKEEKEESSLGFLSSLNTMDAQHQLFFLILIIMCVWEAVSAPLEWNVDDGLYEYLDFADASDHYGSTRVWGVLGAACGVGGTGLLVSQLRCLIAAQTPRSVVHFYCYAGLAFLVFPLAISLPLYLNKKRDRTSRLLKALQLVRGSPRALLCAFTTLLVGVANSAVDNFLLWQMQDHGSSELHMGLSLALALLSQAAFPLMAGRVSKLLSPGRILAVGAASLGLQCFYYSFLWGAWAALPAQVLNCFSSGAIWWAVKLQCEDVATLAAERSVGRVYSLSIHLGSGLGSFAGGFVAQSIGLTWLFRGVAMGLIVWSACLPLLQWKAPHQRRINYSRLLAADASEASDSESEQERDWLDKAMENDRSNNNNERRVNH
ncbi:major facilitator superfamily domain-containing protein 6-like [Archocentrus centrarchus]|uniref:major facilitator superfamily domain-containing protein 6-like n=1 Tax=Archocentrus centrarchus TaxID=63155 RepID=UPI0011E9EC93|nr:major facilitator superfamily domain-containing protein 6-like [Archocentrus centrarchus]